MITNEFNKLNIPFSLLEDFNKEKFSVYSASFNEYYQYRFIDNPFCEYPNDTIYSVIDEGKYIAQMMTMPTPLSFNEQEIPAYWGQDYYVNNEYQGQGIGKKLSALFLGKNYYISVGFTKVSSIVHKKGGCRCIGFLDFYQKWRSPLAKLRFIIHRALKFRLKPLNEYHFPEEINTWKRVHSADDFHLPKKNWNEDTVEVLRDKKYMQWRYFYMPNRYFCYQSTQTKPNENASYFVCKVFFFRGVNWLRIVDYRFQKQHSEDFENMVKSAEQLAKELDLFGVLFPSSMKITNDTLEHYHFEKTAHKEVLTMYPFAHAPMEENDEMHNHFFITFADNDNDMHTNQGKFNYGKDY